MNLYNESKLEYSAQAYPKQNQNKQNNSYYKVIVKTLKRLFIRLAVYRPKIENASCYIEITLF